MFLFEGKRTAALHCCGTQDVEQANTCLVISLDSGNIHGSFHTYQRFGVAEDVILEELVQHVEKVVMHQGLYNQLIQVMLEI